MDRRESFYRSFLSHFGYEPTTCQDAFLGDVAAFLTEDNGDILVANGYAGTGKTTALAAIVATMGEMEIPCVLLAPTGRAAKVLSSYTGRPAYTIHKRIYRQKTAGDMSAFSLKRIRSISWMKCRLSGLTAVLPVPLSERATCWKTWSPMSGTGSVAG